MFRSFTLNRSAPDFYPDVTILDSQGSADWDTLYSNRGNESNEPDPHYILKQLRLSNINKVMIGHLNINWLRNKFGMLIDIVKGKVDILVISETKLDDSFPLSQFCIDGYKKSFRLDRNSHGGGLIVFVREDIPCKQLFAQKCDLEAIFFELNLKNTKWLCCGGYNNHNNNISGYVKAIENCLDIFIKNYENLLILGDFSAESDDPHI